MKYQQRYLIRNEEKKKLSQSTFTAAEQPQPLLKIIMSID